MFPGNPPGVRFFIKPGPTDLRKSINGLSIMAQEGLAQDPFSGNIFVFCNRRRTILKVCYWERNGFCLWLKRLEKDRFPWPDTVSEGMEIRREQFLWLLSGIDFFRAHRDLKYTKLN